MALAIKLEINKAKISFFFNEKNQIVKALIYNFGQVIDFTTVKITFNNYEIVGQNLKIMKMEDQEIEIAGIISKFDQI